MRRSSIANGLLIIGLILGLPALCQSVSATSDAPLATRITSQTLESLVAYAAKDRLCRPIVANSFKRAFEKFRAEHPGWNPMTPLPRVHSYDPLSGEIPFGDCIYDMTKETSVCDATAEDLATLRTLMERDARLASVTTFLTVVKEIREHCGDRFTLPANMTIRTWPDRQLHGCDKRKQQPVLIAQAIQLPLNNRAAAAAHKSGNEKLFEQIQVCRYMWGWSFAAGEQCQLLVRHYEALARNRQRAAQGREARPVPRFEKLGIEEYFCPDSVATYH
jgi:hypothetical protein